MTLKTLNFSARLAASLFAGSVIIGTVSSLIMLGLLLSESESGFVFPTLEGVRVKYAYPLIVTSMKTSMYEYVADDADIETVQKWIDEGAEEAFFKKEVQPIMKGDKVVRARVNQGAPVLVPEEVPVDPSQRLVPIGVGHSTAQRATGNGSEFFNPNDMVFDWPVAVPGHSFAVTGVSMGNPHAVTFTDTPVDELALSDFGPMVEHHALFPNRVNFEVVNVIDRTHLTARVWERGAGLTLACGSGACAIAVAARLHGYIDDNVDIKLPGGTLSLTWDGKGDVFLEGPVELVYEGEWPV